MRNKKFSNNITGASGEYYVAAELCRRGLIATITLKNMPGVDIIATDVDGKKSAIIQVKTRRIDNAKNDFPIASSPIRKKGRKFFYVFVSLEKDSQPDYYIIPQSIVAEYVEGEFQKWIKADKKRKSKLRVLHNKALHSLFNKYHNNWSILGL